jgi:predicted enzyme related to lactoylglutathione lyase
MYPTSQSSPLPSTPTVGSPCWLELATDQPEAAMTFYQQVMGWDYEVRDDSDGVPYYVASLAGDPVAAIRPVAEPIMDWIVYLLTDDLAATVKLAEQLGGGIVETAHSVPKVGLKALVEAPAGAVFGACQPAPDWTFTAGMPNTLVWAEFITHLARQADQFFGELFGFLGQQFGDGADDDYMVWYAGDDSVIGRARMMPGTPSTVPARWMAHFRTPLDRDFDDALVLAHEAGARLRFRPFASQIGRVAMLSDPTGARFALIDPSLAVEGGGGSGADDPFDD